MVLAKRSPTILEVNNLFCDVEVSSCVIELFTITYETFPVLWLLFFRVIIPYAMEEGLA